MEPSLFIGSSIFLYIVGFIIVMLIGAYLTYRIRPNLKHKRDKTLDDRSKKK